MSYLQTTDDLRTDALWRAGEPQSSASSFWAKSLEYLNRIQMTLMMGGAVAVGRDLATSAGIYAHMVNLPITDWWWARRRGVFNTAASIDRTLTLMAGPTALLSSVVNTPLAGWFFSVAGKTTVMRIVEHTPGTATLTFDADWPEDATLTAGDVTLFKLEYDLPGDFLRFSAPPYAHSYFGSTIDVGSIEQRDTDWPLSLNRQGRPTRAFMVAPQRVALNGYDDRSYRIDFEYIFMPTTLTAGSLPTLPMHHRQVLASGAAMLMCFDKSDSKAEQLASEYRELVSRMVQEHRRALTGGSSTFGVFRTRQPTFFSRSPQTYGELYLT